jgi:hypothetical protein
METIGNKIMPKLCPRFNCVICDYHTSKKSSYNNHLLSAKHQNSIKGDVLETFGDEIMLKLCSNKFTCQKCDKTFESRNGLWKHNKKCNLVKNINNNQITNNFIDINEQNEPSDKQLIMMLIKENSEFKNMMMKVLDNGTNNTVNTTMYNVNSNNKTFNLQVFLNETCKDAMNITDFVNSIQLQLSDLENVGKVGYIEGISNIIIKNLKALDVEKRPVHCTDQKREVIYVKEDNIWEKEDETNKQLRKAIKLVAHKNICMLKAFRDKYPDFDDGDSRKSTQYNKIVIEAMGGKGDNEYEKDTKIIKKIAKVVGIDKE